MKEHTLYALSNPSMPGVVKIGITDNLQERLVSLYNTSTPFKFEVVSKIVYPSRDKALKSERYLHNYLWMLRANDSREFFYLTKEGALNVFEKLLQDGKLPEAGRVPKHTADKVSSLEKSISILKAQEDSWRIMYELVLSNFEYMQKRMDTLDTRIEHKQEMLLDYGRQEVNECKSIRILNEKIKKLRNEKRLVSNEREEKIQENSRNYYDNKYKQQLKDTHEELRAVVRDISILHPIKKYRANKIINSFYKNEYVDSGKGKL